MVFLGNVIASRYFYVVLNSLISLVVFGRNFLFMNTFGLGDIGQIALMQTIIMLVGFLQFGLISGAYILWAGGDAQVNRQIADILFAGKAVLLVFACTLLLILGPSVGNPTVAPKTMFFGVTAGILSLASTWMNNTLVADQRLAASSLINTLAAAMSLAVAFLAVMTSNMALALAAIAAQPLVVMVGAMATQANNRPRWCGLDVALMGRLWSVGSRPFLGSLAILAVYQIERWSIAAVLGAEALGRYYIVVLYSSLFVLVPAALMNVYFPKAMRALQAGDTGQFASFVRRHIIEVGAYLAVALVGTVVLVPPFIAMALPQFVGTENLLLLAFIASTVFVVQDTGTLVLYATEQTTPIMIGCLLALVAFCLTLATVSWFGSFTLETVVVARIVSALFGTTYLVVYRQRALGKV